MRTSESAKLGHLKAKVFQSPYSAVVCEGRKKHGCDSCGWVMMGAFFVEGSGGENSKTSDFQPFLHVSNGLKSH